MNLPADAARDLRQCGPALFRYVVAAMLAALFFRLFAYAAQLTLQQDLHPQLLTMARLLNAIYLAVAISAAQAVYLSVLGAAIDKPLWKYKGAKDALRRFFILWFIANLAIITLVDVQARFMATDMVEFASLIEFAVLAANVGVMPVGAAIMHWGALDWSELGEALRPLGRLFPLTLLPIAAGFLLYALSSLRLLAIGAVPLFGTVPETELNGIALIFLSITDIPLLMLEAYIFALAWRLCMHYRTLPPETDDPFDF